MNPLVVPLTLSKKDFQTNAESARLDMERLGGEVKDTSGTLAVLTREARAAGDAIDAGLTAKIKQTQTALVGLKQDLRSATADFKTLSAAAPSLPSMPKASVPRAAVGVAEQAAEGVAGAGISRMGKMELGHVGMAMSGSLAAGIPLDRTLMMESPRLMAALGPAALSAIGGLGGLAAVLAPLTAAVAAAAAGFVVYNANQEAKKQRNANDQIGNITDVAGDSAADLDKNLDDATAAEKKTRHMRHSKTNHLANLAGLGLHDEDVEDIRERKVGVRGRRDDALERDAGFSRRAFEGDQSAGQDKLTADFQAKKKEILTDQASGKFKDGDRQVAIAREQYELASAELARRQQGTAIELAAEQQIVSVRTYGKNVETETAKVRLEAAQKMLANGPQQGPEHDANQTRVWGAQEELAAAGRRQAGQEAAAAAEEKIVAIKRAGLNVDIKSAQQRLETAQGTLDRSPVKSGVEYDALHAAVSAAQLEVEQAVKATKEKQSQLQLESQIASLRGSSDQVHKATLEAERADIERRLELAKGDQIQPLVNEQARNQQQQDEYAKNRKLRDIDNEQAEDRAHAGRGVAGQVQQIMLEQSRNQERREWNKNENGNDQDTNAQLDEQAAQLKRTLEDVTFAEKQHLTALNETTFQLEQHGRNTPGAKKQEIAAGYDEKIAQASHNEDHAAVAALTHQKSLAIEDVDIDEELMTPAEKRKRARQNLKRQQAQGRVEQRRRNHEETQAANDSMGVGSSFDDFFHPKIAGPHAVQVQPNRSVDAPNMANTAHADATKAGFKGAMGTVESLLSKLVEQCKFREE